MPTSKTFKVTIIAFLLLICTQAAFGQVQSVGDVTFAVPNGWTYKPGANFGAVVLTSGAELINKTIHLFT